MNKKLGRLADPTMGLYFGVLAAFAVASFLLDQPILAAAEAGAGGLLFLFYRLRKNHRSKELAAYIQSTTNTLESASKGEMPLPMALIRLVDGEIVWSNQRFNQVSGMKQTLFEQEVSGALALLPPHLPPPPEAAPGAAGRPAGKIPRGIPGGIFRRYFPAENGSTGPAGREGGRIRSCFRQAEPCTGLFSLQTA